MRALRVPLTFKLTQRPVQPVIEEEPRQIGDEVIPIDASGRNPNGVEFDNLYLDMNGIVSSIYFLSLCMRCAVC